MTVTGERNKLGKGLALLGLSVAALAGLLFLGLSDHWRARALRLKLTGNLHEVSWRQILPTVDASSAANVAWRSDLVTLSEIVDHGHCRARWDTPIGQLWGRLGDESVLEYLLREQLIERIYHNQWVAVQAGDTVLDVGGHLGTFSRFSLNQGARQVIVFEPEPTNSSCLERTFEREISDRRVILIKAAAWKESGTLQFEVPNRDAVQGHVVDQGSLSVRAVTIDEIVNQLALSRVDFIKMDIEGAEREALHGAAETLARFGPRMSLSIYHKSDDPEVIPALALAARPQYEVITTERFAYFD